MRSGLLRINPRFREKTLHNPKIFATLSTSTFAERKAIMINISMLSDPDTLRAASFPGSPRL